MKNKYSLVCCSMAISLLLLGCGGEDDSPPQKIVTDTDQPKSTALADFKNISPSDVEVFVTKKLLLPLNEIEFQGEIYFVKIQSSFKQIVFLGQLPHNQAFELSVNIELGAFPLTVEVFSENENDKAIVWEETYE
ncbi:MAG: hypothetical protein HRT51_11235 [Colwellia sp.]|nr:hypothetical protein [Colwellia sp.]